MGSNHFDWINVDVSGLRKSCSRPLPNAPMSFMNDRLYRFAHSSEILTPFVQEYGCGWFDGGCFIFARALQL